MNILSDKDAQLLQLLNLLYFHGPRSSYDLINSMNISSSKLLSSINILNDTIYPCKVFPKNHMVHLSIPQNGSYDFCVSKILAASLECSIVEYIFFEQYESYISLANALHVSESTVKRSIKQMNLFFEQYDIIIKARPLRFEGDENNIRYFFILYFTAKYNLIDLPFKKKLIYQLEQFYTLVSTIFRNKPTIQDRLNFTLFSAVAYEREKNNHPLVIRNAPKITFLINILNSLPTKFTHLNKIDSKSELDFWIRTFSLFTNNKTFNSTPMLSKNKQKKIFERTGIEQFLFLFSKIFKIELTDNERFTISKELYELLFGFLKPKNIINSLNNHYSAFYKSNDFFLDSYKILTKKIFVHCFSEELFPYFDFFFFVLTTHSISLLDNFYSLFAKINITIYIDFDFQFSIYVQNKLEKLLPGNMNFLLIDSADKLYNTNGISESDLFITNIYNYKSIGIAFKEIYILSHHISEFDIENITDIITEVYKKNYSGIILEGEEILKQYFNTDM